MINRWKREKEAQQKELLACGIGFLGGIFAGSVATALLTPKSGPELRRDIKEQGKSATSKIKSKIAVCEK